MDDILINIEQMNCQIEDLLDRDFKLSGDDVKKIADLYSQKRNLINDFVVERNKEENDKLINSDKLTWKSKLDKYIAKDKQVMDKLDLKVKQLGASIKENQTNKKLLIYNKY